MAKSACDFADLLRGKAEAGAECGGIAERAAHLCSFCILRGGRRGSLRGAGRGFTSY